MTALLLKQDGGALLKEDGGGILLEQQPKLSAVTRIDAFDADGNLVDLIPRWKSVGWTDESDQLGAGHITVDALDTRIRQTLRDARRLEVHVGGQLRGGILLHSERQTRGQAGELTINGTGPKGLLAETVIYPPAGEGFAEVRKRRYDWTNPRFDAARLTGTVTDQGTVDNPSASSVWDPAEMVDGAAHWLWVDQSGTVSPGTVFLRRDFTTASDLEVVLEGSCDDEMDLILDGVELLSVRGEGKFTETFSPDPFTLPAGDHTLAIRGHNLQRSYGDSPAGVVCSLMEQASDGSADPNSVVVRTEPTNWVGIGYTATPGMTPGEIKGQAIDEAQAEGDIPDVTYSFSDAADSDGNAWPNTYAFARQVGEPLDKLADQLIGLGPDLWVTPDGTVHMVPDRGQDVSDTVLLTEGSEITEGGLSFDAERVDGNVVLANTESGGWSQHKHSSADDPLIGRRVAFLRLGSVDEADAAGPQVNEYFRKHALRIVYGHIDLVKSPRAEPYADFGVGFRVSGPDYDFPGELMVQRVVSISGEQTADDTEVSWHVETQETQ